MFLLALLLALESICFASGPVGKAQSLVLYRDCTPEKTPTIPVFAEWQDRIDRKPKAIEIPSTYYINGIQISVEQEASGRLKRIHFGDHISIPLSGLLYGIRFGALNSVIHTLEADPAFDPVKGGVIRFGYDKSFKISDMIHDLSHPAQSRASLGPLYSVSAYQKILKGEKWVEKKYRLVRQNGQWVVLDFHSHKPVHAIYTLMKTEALIKINGTPISSPKVISGVTGMVDEYASGDSHQCSSRTESAPAPISNSDEKPLMRSVVEDPESHTTSLCITE